MTKTNVTLKFPAQLSKYIDNVEAVEFEGNRFSDFINHMDTSFGSIRERLFESNERVRPYINIFIGKKNIESLDGMNSVVPQGERISVLLSRAGG